MYGPIVPNAFENMKPIEMPVCRKHVGYVSMDCKKTMKNNIAIQNFTITVKMVAYNSKLGSGK